jgi:hypothetical protein
MWHWSQGNGQSSALELGQHNVHATHQSELGDMLHMLGHHTAAAASVQQQAAHQHGFENLGGMFSGQYH